MNFCSEKLMWEIQENVENDRQDLFFWGKSHWIHSMVQTNGNFDKLVQVDKLLELESEET